MKFSCEKALLQNAVSLASRVVTAKSSISALEGILVEAGEELSLTGYNLQTGIRSTIPAQVEEKGAMVLSARLFGDIVRSLPDEPVEFLSSGNIVSINCGMSNFSISSTLAEDFPSLPSVEHNNTLTLTQGQLKSMIAQTVFAVSTNESRPIQTGSLFEVDETGLNLVSVDGYRLALRHETLAEKEGGDSFSFVVPGATLSEVEKICADSEEPVHIIQGERNIQFQMGSTTLISRRLEGEFLRYRNAIPTESAISVKGNTADLLASFGRVSLLVTEKLKSPMRCEFGDGNLYISTITAIGTASDQCAIEGDGKGTVIGFNGRYMMDALKAAPADRVRIEFSSDVAPCLILPEEETRDDFLYMVLPVRIRAD